MKYEKALKVYTDYQEQLKADSTISLPGEVVQAIQVLKDSGFDFSEKKEEAPAIEEKVEEITTQEETEND